MALTRVQLKNFTAFAELDLELSPGINVLVGANGTGKTHLMKVCYAACEVSRASVSSENVPVTPFMEKLTGVFLPWHRSIVRLVRNPETGGESKVEVFRNRLALDISISIITFSDSVMTGSYTGSLALDKWLECPVHSIYIPVKEMLSNAPGFRSLYAEREVHFEEVYKDILDRAYLPPLREPLDENSKCQLNRLQEGMGGEISVKNEEFFLQGAQGDIEFMLLAEGIRKLGLLWLLIRNGSLRPGSVLFWDEPEANLNPKLYGVVVEVLLELQRNGVQVFLATHDYGVLKELELRSRNGDYVAYHSLYHDEVSGEIACNTARRYLDIHPNVIEEAFEEIYDRQIERSLGDFGR